MGFLIEDFLEDHSFDLDDRDYAEIERIKRRDIDFRKSYLYEKGLKYYVLAFLKDR